MDVNHEIRQRINLNYEAGLKSPWNEVVKQNTVFVVHWRIRSCIPFLVEISERYLYQFRLENYLITTLEHARISGRKLTFIPSQSGEKIDRQGLSNYNSLR